MNCPNCKSDNSGKLGSQTIRKGANEKFAEQLVCLDCGTVFMDVAKVKASLMAEPRPEEYDYHR